LKGGETIKIGRVKFRVREVVIQETFNSNDENKTDINSFRDLQLPNERILG